MPLHLHRFTLGDWMTNAYVVASDGVAWIIDAPYEPGEMIDHARSHRLTIERIILTHAHLDHIGGLADVHAAFPDAPICIHDAERDFLGDPTLNLSAFIGIPLRAPPATDALAHGDRLPLAGHVFEVRHTPGHSPGGITLYAPDHGLALVGDTLFRESIGRTDFPTSDHDTLLASIRDQLFTLPDATRVLPGHMEDTTIAHEKHANPFVRP